MGGCCAVNKPVEIPDINEVEVESLSNNIINYQKHKNKIEKIQSVFRGMKVRKKVKKQQITSSNIISNETNAHFPEINSKEYR